MFKPSWDPGECRGSESGTLKRKENLENPLNWLKLKRHRRNWSGCGVRLSGTVHLYKYVSVCVGGHHSKLLVLPQFLPPGCLAPDGLPE